MGRLIDADALVDSHVIKNGPNDLIFMRKITLKDIDDAPTVDAVPVIRCLDCRRHKYGKFCDRTGVNAGPDDFCSYAEPVEKSVESVDNHGD